MCPVTFASGWRCHQSESGLECIWRRVEWQRVLNGNESKMPLCRAESAKQPQFLPLCSPLMFLCEKNHLKQLPVHMSTLSTFVILTAPFKRVFAFSGAWITSNCDWNHQQDPFCLSSTAALVFKQMAKTCELQVLWLTNLRKNNNNRLANFTATGRSSCLWCLFFLGDVLPPLTLSLDTCKCPIWTNTDSAVGRR